MKENKSPIDYALRQFEAAEANLEKLESTFTELRSLIPTGVSFGTNYIYDDKCRVFKDILDALPTIDGWKPKGYLWDLDEIAQSKLDSWELGEPAAEYSIDVSIDEPIRELAEYRFKLNKKRRQLIRTVLSECMSKIDILIKALSKQKDVKAKEGKNILLELAQINTLLGASFERPEKWGQLQEHLNSISKQNIKTIINEDWPSINSWLSSILYDRNEPILVEVKDLGELAKTQPVGTVLTSLNWKNLTAENFERLIFTIISDTYGYENPEWLMNTNASDRGRDLSVTRLVADPLSGIQRLRVIIQCKHGISKPIPPSEIATLREQMILWEPPKVDVLIIATSGRFTADAVSSIEMNNRGDRALRIEMWPETHLELILTKRPALIAEFKLK